MGETQRIIRHVGKSGAEMIQKCLEFRWPTVEFTVGGGAVYAVTNDDTTNLRTFAMGAYEMWKALSDTSGK